MKKIEEIEDKPEINYANWINNLVAYVIFFCFFFLTEGGAKDITWLGFYDV